MKTFFRKLGLYKKLKFVKRAIGITGAAWAFKYGRINETTDLPINFNQEIQSISKNESLIGQKSELTLLVGVG